MKTPFLLRSALLAGVLAPLALAGWAQPALPIARNLQAAYARGTRAATGAPGPKYWQNTAAYNIDVEYNPSSRRLSGTVDIVYQNNSPDTLRQIWFKLYPNLYQEGAPRVNRIAPEDIGDGVQIQQMALNGQRLDVRQLAIDATNLVVPLGASLLPRQSLKVAITYAYTLNQGSHNRTGEVEPGAAFVAYFFPRITVYDDLDGWNRWPYTGVAEFYNDFCTFKASITVPRNYVVWATGDLVNPGEVLSKKYIDRLHRAEQSEGVTTIIDSTDVRRRDITNPAAQNAWRFEARDVPDFVFATADHYVWQAASPVVDPKTQRRTRVDAVYSPQHRDYRDVIDIARRTVLAMSYTFPKWPFPYSHETVFDGRDQMEYPMMVNDNPSATRQEAITLTDHEIFHTMFPFYMGINETKYGWMDEGWATIGEWLISSMIDPTLVDAYGMEPYDAAAGTEVDPPIVTLSSQQTDQAFFLNSYPKPGLGYLFVKDLLGDDLFTRALHTYVRNWHGKHPMPHDFFNSMNAGAGQNLNWFWQRWFFDDGYPDLAIARVAPATSGTAITVEAKGTKPVPIDLLVTFADGTTQKIHRTIAVWQAGARTVAVPVASKKTIKKIVIGSLYVPDSFPKDNVWEALK
ncbi:M1 family metallopeptidase [Hymenobacter coccineus]|uniref:Peptidase n=1 Tax=Hymenobacter coccineus TaxID=1908235 RepID=A0A1G1TMU6_9BACT|nr:M1 family metallopeptidase [Hymenobacter coccineus]OGX92192.1 peptidase [Hymenobacter coccineus]